MYDEKFSAMRAELKDYYFNHADELSKNFCDECLEILDGRYKEGMDTYHMKTLQYEVITDKFEPVIFTNSPFYYETGTMAAHCDGARSFRGHYHAGGWTYWKNSHLFVEQDRELWKRRCSQMEELLYLICGAYNDTDQHFKFYYRPVFEKGLKGIYEYAKKKTSEQNTMEENEFLNSVCSGLLCVKKMAEKFSIRAEELLKTTTNKEEKKNLALIADTAKRVPWEKPNTFYEALNTLAFMRKAVGALEGIGPNTFGRVDLDLYPFYLSDIKSGKLTKEQAYELICRFLITWDCHYDHDMKMVSYADHELENTYVLGGCDADGNLVYNELTEMFLRATREEGIIYPKIKCRFSKNSPKKNFDDINASIIEGTSTVLYQNDDASIPALVRAGYPLAEARDYIVSGCWDMELNGSAKHDCGNYLNLLKPFEFSLHNLTDKIKKTGINFLTINGSENFEEIYAKTVKNFEMLIKERIDISRNGGRIWDKVDVLPIFSSTLSDCIKNKKDFTAGGARYRDDVFLCFGLPNIVDSLLAIKELCFDKKRYTLEELLAAVRSNWKNNEIMRQEAINCHGWGDDSDESNELAIRLNNDLYKITSSIKGTFGGKVLFGHLTYTEVRWWGEKTLATPDGRKNGEYFAQGLTPSRLKKIPSALNVIHAMSMLDASEMAGNSVVNIILPSKNMSLDICESFMRATAKSAVQSLQLNCFTKEQLLDAQKHPEKYPHLIVRVTGFSAKFTSLSPEWQQEVITRNFYKE